MFRRKPLRSTAIRLTAAIAFAALLAVAIYASTLVIPYGDLLHEHDPLIVTDVARLSHARVDRIHEIHEIADLRAAIEHARRQGLKISISGSRHSQGGHTYTDDGIVLNMRGFNRIRSIDPEAMTVTVESGATWDEVQRAIAPRGLADAQVQARTVTRKLVDATLEHGGTCYLTYQLYPAPEQLHQAYPDARHVFDRKRLYDPAEMFTNRFYERYGRASSG